MANVPLEVKLVSDVRTCRTCKWFWGGIPPYGNFPRFDWKEDFPKEIRDQKQTTEWIQPTPILKGTACGQGQIDPGIMHGCRKAPIMTIGINPNMTSYFPSDAGARWSYPNFSKDARYAYYYRHHNVYQESLDPEFIKSNIKEGTKIIAEKDGWLLSAHRSSDHRWALLTYQYVDEDKPRQEEVSWTDDLRFVVFARRSKNMDSKSPGFTKGEIIGAKIENLSANDVQVFKNATGYYQRYVFVLERFKEKMGKPYSSADLSISEDVAQHDMIACASPGWSEAYDIPRDRITHNCVIDHGYLISQLVQSKPAVIVIVGGSVMSMFSQAFAPFLDDFYYDASGEDQGGREIKETYQLLKETVSRTHYLHVKIGDYVLKSRIVVSPHFSYGDNFRPHCRLSADAWKAFRGDFATDAKIIDEKGLRQSNTWNDFVPILIEGVDDAIKEELSSAAWNVLMAYFYDPIDMLADVLEQEIEACRMGFDYKIQRLKRADEGCHFCVNDLWKFPEGCPYDKEKVPSPSAEELERIVSKITQHSRAEAQGSKQKRFS